LQDGPIARSLSRDIMQKQYLKYMRRFYRQLRHPKVRNHRLLAPIAHHLTNRRLWIPCRNTVAHGLAIGMFFAMMLPMPMQSLFAAFFAIRARVNVPAAMAATWSSNLITNVPLAVFQESLGRFLRLHLNVHVPEYLEMSQKVPGVDYQFNAANYVLGMLACGVLVSILCYPLIHLISLCVPHHLPRYRKAPKTILPAVKKQEI